MEKKLIYILMLFVALGLILAIGSVESSKSADVKDPLLSGSGPSTGYIYSADLTPPDFEWVLVKMPQK